MDEETGEVIVDDETGAEVSTSSEPSTSVPTKKKQKVTEIPCLFCAKLCKGERGLSTHERTCKVSTNIHNFNLLEIFRNL